ncbi:response regulator transcription factor [Amycolatopsis rhabdoformis]|uniref:Response regulator transcription factor n=1 Tax=Amycolatopsis rhabdoformis TaxID=1448059 RepID=A0ABZ1IKQ5_9PSEU|nr:response regulator transcription factor [Amycolatopsis rhabdoformis]WSE35114.1 response regulator transcription factor [Amycolatopsis rhabdoformis]
MQAGAGVSAVLLDLEDDIRVVARVGSGDEVLAVARATRPDVVLLDVQMPRKNGLDVAAEVRAELPRCRVLMCTTFGRPGYLTRALAAGAAGFVVKDCPPEQLVDAVRRVHAGLRVIDPSLATESLTLGTSSLTDREREVLLACRDGSTVAAVAGRLHLSAGTVCNYLSSAMGKLEATTRAEAVRPADDRGWL